MCTVVPYFNWLIGILLATVVVGGIEGFKTDLHRAKSKYQFEYPWPDFLDVPVALLSWFFLFMLPFGITNNFC